MSEEEKKAIERQFEMALDTIISKIKGETATAIVHSEQPMILLFKKLVYTIEKQQKEIEEIKKPKYLYNANTGEITRLDNSTESISKCKIKELLEEYGKKDIDYGIEFYNKIKQLIEDNKKINMIDENMDHIPRVD